MSDASRRFIQKLGMRATESRVRILESLQGAVRPVSAEEIHNDVGICDLVTVYRTLQRFVHTLSVREVYFNDGVVRYEFMHGGLEHHHHVMCSSCGLIDELPSCTVGALETAALSKSGRFARIHDHSLEFFGLCVSCAKI